MAEKKKKKRENGASKVNTVKAQLKPERKKLRKKLLKAAQREESHKGVTEVSVHRAAKMQRQKSSDLLIYCLFYP